MSGPAYVSDPTVSYLAQLLDDVAKGYLQIPQFQRRFVWTDEQRLELLQSIRDGIPIGSILVWRTSLASLKTVRNIGPHSLPAPVPSPTSSRSYLLDGLQRLSTLYGCLRPLPPGVSAFTTDDESEEVSWRVGFDLAAELPAEQFQILERGEHPEPTWLPLTLLFDSVQLLRFQRDLPPGSDELIQRADVIAETFRIYKLPVVPVVTEDLAIATRTFERVNRQGTRMSELHMVRALTWGSDFDLEERIASVRDRLAEVGWESLEPEWILKVCKAALRLDIAVEDPDRSSSGIADQPSVIDDATTSLFCAASWLRQHCRVHSPRIVPYRMQIVMLAEALRLCPEPPPAITRSLIQWFWNTTYTGRFAGITGGQTNAMLEMLRGVAGGQALELKGKKREPIFSQPTVFKPAFVRVKAIALRLAALDPLDLDGTSLGADEQLAKDGPGALVPLDLTARGSAGRMFTRTGVQLLRARLIQGFPVDARVLESHAITPEAAEAVANLDFAEFYRLRGAEIRGLEEAFYASTQAED